MLDPITAKHVDIDQSAIVRQGIQLQGLRALLSSLQALTGS